MISAWIDADGVTGGNGPDGAVFPWWSFTKTVMSVCAFRLAEDGVLDLAEIGSGRPYSIRHLMAHRAGLQDYGGLESYHRAVAAGDDPWSAEKLWAEAGADTLLHPPGQEFAYSNIGYMVLRQVLEARTGQSFEKIVAEQITGWLGLTSVKLARERQDFEDIHWDSANGYHPGWVYHGCLTGTASDAVRLLHAVMAGDLLTPASKAKVIRPQFQAGPLPGRPWSEIGYGYGLMQGAVDGVGRAHGHSGCGPFCANAVYHFADHGVTVASFTDGGDEAPAEWETTRIARELIASR